MNKGKRVLFLLNFKEDEKELVIDWLKANDYDKNLLDFNDVLKPFGFPYQNLKGQYEFETAIKNPLERAFYEMLDEKMFRGEPLFVIPPNDLKSEYSKLRAMANEYNTKIFCADFGGEASEKHLRGTEFLNPEEFIKKDKIDIKDFSNFERIVHIGDIHGSLGALKKMLEDVGICDKTLYIFTGDYINRGKENPQTLEFILELSEEKNFIFLEGNHERHLHRWSRGKKSYSLEFENVTRIELERVGISRKRVLSFVNSLRTYLFYKYGSKKVIVNHGGIANVPDRISDIPINQYVRGVGSSDDDIDAAFTKNTQDWYQVHGHRNKHKKKIQASKKSFNLEGAVERGGELRALILDKDGFKAKYIKN